MEYIPIPIGKPFSVAHLSVVAVPVNHIVPTVGLIVSDGEKSVAFSSDTAETDEVWKILNEAQHVDALLIEASFRNRMARLAEVSRHFTPASLGEALKKVNHNGLDIMAVHIKPTYREEIIEQLHALQIPNLSVMEPGKTYDW